MANLTRIKQLQQFIKEDPSDPFNLYALALEYLPEDKNRAEAYYDDLLTRFPKYLPTYFHAANLAVELDKPAKATQIYEKGISLAQEQQDAHALRELKTAFLNFQLEYLD